MKQKKIHLVLGGGGARTLSYLGILDVFQKNNIVFDHITSSSSGSLIGIMIAHKIPLEKIRETFLKHAKYSFWVRPFIKKPLLFKQSPVKEILEELLPSRLIEDTQIPITFVATDIKNMNVVTIENGDAIITTCASGAHPLFNVPIYYNNRYIADGGMVNNVPADIARKKAGKNDIVLTFSCSSPFSTDPGIFLKRKELVLRTIYHPLEIKRNRIARDFSNIVLNPFHDQPLDFKSWKNIFKFHKQNNILHYIEQGKQEAEKRLPEILRIIV